jgi:hypothetical protein
MFASASCAVIVTLLPATGLLLLDVTMYLVAVPATVVIVGLVPVRLEVSVPVTVWAVPAVVLVVKTTLATPLLSVVLVPLANEPPVPVLLHVTTRPELATLLLLASTNCAVIVTELPATGFVLLVLTRYFAGAPIIVTMFGLVPVRACASVPVTV